MSDFEPGAIKRLDAVVVNRIAAGEIIQRPANALKELIENSLDAKSTNIQITVNYGGLKFLQIKDNGTGIRKDDLEIVCERFTTSKLKDFEDLQSISTYGFRGEALSSISHVAHLTIQTKTVNDKVGYKAAYEDGKLKDTIRSIAGNQGTQITVEDLFYNVKQRRQSLKSPNEEYQRIFDVVSKYSVHNSRVSFTLRKQGETITLRTPSNSSQLANVRIIYGSEVANELKQVESESAQFQFKMFALTTSVNYSSKKFTFLLFINHRLVESPALKNAIDHVYGAFLPKGNHPFVYMHLLIESNNVDVNVHPTKHEVHFLYEDEIIERIRQAFETKLVGSNETRDLYTQSLLPGATDPTQNDHDMNETSKETKIYAKDMVRSDSKEQKLEKFFGQCLIKSATSPSAATSNKSMDRIEIEMDNDDNSFSAIQSSTMMSMSQTSVLITSQRTNDHNKRKQTKLTSILTLRNRVETKCNDKLRRIISESRFIGCVRYLLDVNRQLFLLQFESSLYLCDIQKLSEELFYQKMLYDFENFNQIQMEPPLSIKRLAQLALEDIEASGWCEEDGPIDELSETVKNTLVQKGPILKEYYGIVISNDGLLHSLPLILDEHMPSMAHLPMYILRLVTEVNWLKEKECFETFSRETAKYYSRIPLSCDENQWKWLIEHVLFDNIKKYLIPSNQMESSFLKIASLANLYKVFERC